MIRGLLVFRPRMGGGDFLLAFFLLGPFLGGLCVGGRGGGGICAFPWGNF